MMGKVKYDWHDTKYALSYFGRRLREAREEYLSYVETGFFQDRRPELVGGGLIRSLGGWDEVKKKPFTG